MRTSIDPTTLRELLRYDAGDGVLYWRERDSKFFQPTEKREASGHAKWWNGRFAGKRACKSDCNRGYLRVCLFGDEYPAHRVIWAMETGQWPTNVIDHIDGDPANNRIANLRSATTAENNRNKANHGRSRFRGVSWRARQSIWVSAIKTNKKVTFLGCYKDEEDAARAYDVAAIEQHGNFARTNFPRADYEARIKSALASGPSDPSSTRNEVTVPCGLDRPSESQCPNMKEVGGGMEGERYSCAVCGKGYYLDYDDMR